MASMVWLFTIPVVLIWQVQCHAPLRLWLLNSVNSFGAHLNAQMPKMDGCGSMCWVWKCSWLHKVICSRGKCHTAQLLESSTTLCLIVVASMEALATALSCHIESCSEVLQARAELSNLLAQPFYHEGDPSVKAKLPTRGASGLRQLLLKRLNLLLKFLGNTARIS